MQEVARARLDADSSLEGADRIKNLLQAAVYALQGLVVLGRDEYALPLLGPSVGYMAVDLGCQAARAGQRPIAFCLLTVSLKRTTCVLN
jgi:hypothetical protein